MGRRLTELLVGTAVAVLMVAAAGVAWAKEHERSASLAKPAGAPPAKEADAKLDRAPKKLVAVRGGPPGVIAIVQR